MKKKFEQFPDRIGELNAAYGRGFLIAIFDDYHRDATGVHWRHISRVQYRDQLRAGIFDGQLRRGRMEREGLV